MLKHSAYAYEVVLVFYMKKIAIFAAIIAAFVFASCEENRIENELSFSAGPAEKDTVILRDTFVTTDGDTVAIREKIECYELLKNNVMALEISNGDLLEVSFSTNLALEKKINGEKQFSQFAIYYAKLKDSIREYGWKYTLRRVWIKLRKKN